MKNSGNGKEMGKYVRFSCFPWLQKMSLSKKNNAVRGLYIKIKYMIIEA